MLVDFVLNNSWNFIHYLLKIRLHCSKFRSGLDDVVSIDWLRLFDHNELQVLISGAQTPIDVDDLREHTNYSGSYLSCHVCISKC
jgi:ubiquitin-protein ligase E3 C